MGHVLSEAGVRPDESKVEKVKNWPIPRKVTEIKAFLGLAGYYRRFIKDFSKISQMMRHLEKKNVPFLWEDKQQEAFVKLKEALIQKPILQYRKFDSPFILTTDASNTSIGSVLSQGIIGVDLPIAYYSRSLNKAERNYCTIEKECLAIVEFYQTFQALFVRKKMYFLYRP